MIAQLKEIRDNFKKELIDAAEGKKTSLSFLKTNLPRLAIRPNRFQVMVVGGTNFSQALMRHDGEAIIISESSESLEFPDFTKGSDILELISSHLQEDAEYLVINFAYPLESIIRDGMVDGIIREETKGHKFSDLLGKALGFEIERYALEKTGRKIRVAVSNDTTCLVLSGLHSAPHEKVVGVINGTGYNMGFFLDKDTIVNLEAGRFSNFPETKSGRAILSQLQNPNIRKFEAEVSGDNLYKHFNYFIKKGELDYGLIDSTEELFRIAYKDTKSKEAGQKARQIIKNSASLVAAQIAGMAEFKNLDLAVIMEGSLFTPEYKALVGESIRELTEYSVKFEHIENSALLGASFLV